MELWARNCPVILPKFRLPRKFRNLLHAVNVHGTDGFTSPPKEGVLRIFFRPKNPTASAGFEPAISNDKKMEPQENERNVINEKAI